MSWMLRLRRWIIFFICFPLPLLLYRSTLAGPLSLQEAVEKALEKSPAVSAHRKMLEASTAKQQAAFSGFLPKVGFRESYLRSDQPVASFGNLLNQGRFTAQDFDLDRLNDPDSLENFQTKFSVRQPLFTGGKVQNQYRMANREKEAARWDVEGALAEIGFQTIQAYWGFSLAGESVSVAQMAVATAQESLRQIELLHAEGTVVRSDLLSAKVRLADFQDTLVRARGKARLAETALKILVGEGPDGRWEVSSLVPPGSEEIPGLDSASLFDVAKRKRPDYISLRSRAEAAAAGVRAARGNFLPQFGVEASYEWNAPRFSEDLEGSYLLGVGLDWSLFEGLRDRASLKEARSNDEAARYRLRSHEDRIRLEIEEAVIAVQTNQESLQVTQERVAHAEENLRIVQQRYREGLTTVVELEQAELALSSSRFQKLQAIHDLRISLAKLRWVTGELVQSLPLLSCSPFPAPAALPPRTQPDAE